MRKWKKTEKFNSNKIWGWISHSIHRILGKKKIVFERKLNHLNQFKTFSRTSQTYYLNFCCGVHLWKFCHGQEVHEGDQEKKRRRWPIFPKCLIILQTYAIRNQHLDFLFIDASNSLEISVKSQYIRKGRKTIAFSYTSILWMLKEKVQGMTKGYP